MTNGAAKKQVKAAWARFGMVAKMVDAYHPAYREALDAARAVEARTGLTMDARGRVTR